VERLKESGVQSDEVLEAIGLIGEHGSPHEGVFFLCYGTARQLACDGALAATERSMHANDAGLSGTGCSPVFLKGVEICRAGDVGSAVFLGHWSSGGCGCDGICAII
jgi:hypothetical protein